MKPLTLSLFAALALALPDAAGQVRVRMVTPPVDGRRDAIQRRPARKSQAAIQSEAVASLNKLPPLYSFGTLGGGKVEHRERGAWSSTTTTLYIPNFRVRNSPKERK